MLSAYFITNLLEPYIEDIDAVHLLCTKKDTAHICRTRIYKSMQTDYAIGRKIKALKLYGKFELQLGLLHKSPYLEELDLTEVESPVINMQRICWPINLKKIYMHQICWHNSKYFGNSKCSGNSNRISLDTLHLELPHFDKNYYFIGLKSLIIDHKTVITWLIKYMPPTVTCLKLYNTGYTTPYNIHIPSTIEYIELLNISSYVDFDFENSQEINRGINTDVLIINLHDNLKQITYSSDELVTIDKSNKFKGIILKV